jgi:predicted transcriptional regulator
VKIYYAKMYEGLFGIRLMIIDAAGEVYAANLGQEEAEKLIRGMENRGANVFFAEGNLTPAEIDNALNQVTR